MMRNRLHDETLRLCFPIQNGGAKAELGSVECFKAFRAIIGARLLVARVKVHRKQAVNYNDGDVIGFWQETTSRLSQDGWGKGEGIPNRAKSIPLPWVRRPLEQVYAKTMDTECSLNAPCCKCNKERFLWFSGDSSRS
jgi:hypothetical protein